MTEHQENEHCINIACEVSELLCNRLNPAFHVAVLVTVVAGLLIGRNETSDGDDNALRAAVAKFCANLIKVSEEEIETKGIIH